MDIRNLASQLQDHQKVKARQKNKSQEMERYQENFKESNERMSKKPFLNDLSQDLTGRHFGKNLQNLSSKVFQPKTGIAKKSSFEKHQQQAKPKLPPRQLHQKQVSMNMFNKSSNPVYEQPGIQSDVFKQSLHLRQNSTYQSVNTEHLRQNSQVSYDNRKSS